MKRVKIVLEKPLTKVYLLFLCSALPIISTGTCSNNLQFFMFSTKSSMALIRKFILQFMNSEYVFAAEHVSQVCIDNSEEYLHLHERFCRSQQTIIP